MDSQSKRNKVPKTTKRRLNDLEDHLFFLKKDLEDFKDEPSLYKRISAELRLLICKMQRNKPLLLNLIKELGDPSNYNVKTINKRTEKITITNIMDYPKKYSGYFYKGHKYSIQDIIVSISSQDGTGHEDRSLDEGIAYNEGVFISGIGSPNLFILNQIGRNVVRIGFQFLNALDKNGEYSLKRQYK